MNAIITRYKKTVLSAMMLVGMSINGAEAAKCSPCQAAAAERKSARDAAAAALSIAATVAKSMELDLSDSQDMPRAPREELPLCNMCASNPKSSCCITPQLQALINSEALCCAVINEKLDRQEKEAGKCCKKITHKLEEIEVLVESLIDQPAMTCCSVVDNIQTLVVAQTAASAACCSVMELQISNLNASIADVFTLLMSVWDCTCDT